MEKLEIKSSENISPSSMIPLDARTPLDTRRLIRRIVNSSIPEDVNLINNQQFWKDKFYSHFGNPNFESNNWFYYYQSESNKRTLYLHCKKDNPILEDFQDFYSSSEKNHEYPSSDIARINPNIQYHEIYFGRSIKQIKIYKNLIAIIDSSEYLWLNISDINFGFTEQLGNFYSNPEIRATNVYIGQYAIFFIDKNNKLNIIGKKNKYFIAWDSGKNNLYETSTIESKSSAVISTVQFPVTTPTFQFSASTPSTAS